jgi:hypothetical protein
VSSVASAVYWDDAQRAGGTSDVRGRSVAVAADGTVLITGSFQGTAYFPTSAEDSIALTSFGGTDVFVAALNTDDSYFAWAQRASSSGTFKSAAGSSLAVAADGTVLVTGYFAGTASFPTSAEDSIALTATGGQYDYDVFVAALNKDDSYFAWAQRAGSSGTFKSAVGSSLAVAADGTVLVTGYFQDTATFPTSAEDSIALTSPGGLDVFVAALNKDDSYFAWAQRAGGTDAEEGNSVAVAADGTVLVTGYFRGTASFPTSADESIALTSTIANRDDVFVAALNEDDSYFAWAQQAGSTNSDRALSVAVAADGTVLVTGRFQDTAYFPTSADESIALTSAGNNDVFVAALNEDDSYFAWAQRAGGAGADVGNSVAVAADGTVLVTGYFRGTAYFPTGALADDSIALTSTVVNRDDVFVAALNKDESYFAWAQQAGSTGFDAGNSVAVARDGTVLITGSIEGTATFPTSAEDSIALTSAVGSDMFVGWLLTPLAPPVPPAPPVPAGAPTGVIGEPGDGQVSVSWATPASSGSFPISTYQAVAAPGGQTCLIAVPALTCPVSGLTNGTTYTFSVRALTGAGWGSWSEVSDPVTPEAPETVSVLISGARSDARGKRPGVIVAGTSTGVGPGAIMRPMVRFPGQTTYTQGAASILVDEDGAFTWQRKTGKKTYIYVVTQEGTARSNRVIIPAR